jgi:hypothetical protein
MNPKGLSLDVPSLFALCRHEHHGHGHTSAVHIFLRSFIPNAKLATGSSATMRSLFGRVFLQMSLFVASCSFQRRETFSLLLGRPTDALTACRKYSTCLSSIPISTEGSLEKAKTAKMTYEIFIYIWKHYRNPFMYSS